MKIIISPAKAMNVDWESYEVKRLPLFLDKTKILMNEIKKLSFDEAKALWKCNDKLAELNFNRFSHMDVEKALTPAVFSYEGLQYKNMGPKVLSESGLEYIDKHLRILSGFYGILKPFDGVVPYRLEMQAKLSAGSFRNLYEFWGGQLYEAISDESFKASNGEKHTFTILNLASREYSQAIEKYVTAGCKFVTVDFGELIDGKVKQKATLAKMARGDMVRFMAERNITSLEEIKKYNGFGFRFSKELSGDNRLVFIKERVDKELTW